MRERIRACLLPVLVVSIVGSLWVLAEAQEVESDSQDGRFSKPIVVRGHTMGEDPDAGPVAGAPVEH